MDKVRKPRSDSKMYQLPKDVLEQINIMLLNDNMKYSDIQHWLETEQHVKIALSSISNYSVRLFRSAQRTVDELQRTKSLLNLIGENSEVDASKAATAILKSGLLQKISTAEEEFNEMSIEKAGRLLVEINRTEIANGKLELDSMTKSELAFKALEDTISAVIKNNKEDKETMKAIMARAKTAYEKEFQ